MANNDAVETDEETVRRIGNGLVSAIATSTKRRRRWTQGTAALGGAAVLFAAGVLVGGAVSPIPKTTGPTITVDCYNTADPQDNVTDITEYTTTTDLATASSRAPQACNQADKSQTMTADVENYANQFNAATGATCGTLNASNGTVWSFGFYPISKKNPGGAGWLSEGKPNPPLGPNCITKSITVTTWVDQPMALCRVDATKFNVYPRGTQTAATLCESQGLTPLNL